MNTIEINGKYYQQKPSSTTQMSGKLQAMLLMSMAMTTMVGGGGYGRKRPQVDIIEEYKLIQQKKSKLSKSDRDWVKYQFRKNFREVSQEEIDKQDRNYLVVGGRGVGRTVEMNKVIEKIKKEHPGIIVIDSKRENNK